MSKTVRILVGAAAISVCSLFYLAITSNSLSAQAESKVASEQLFQISAWGFAVGERNSGSNTGAYIIDCQSGTVWSVTGNSAPREIGSVK